MTPTVITVAVGILATILLSVLFSNMLYRRKSARRKQEIEEKSQLIIKEAEITAENIKKDKILEAKEKILKMRSEFEEEATRKKNLIINNEQKIKQREQSLSKELEAIKRREGELDDLRTDLVAQLEHVKKRK